MLLLESSFVLERIRGQLRRVQKHLEEFGGNSEEYNTSKECGGHWEGFNGIWRSSVVIGRGRTNPRSLMATGRSSFEIGKSKQQPIAILAQVVRVAILAQVVRVASLVQNVRNHFGPSSP